MNLFQGTQLNRSREFLTRFQPPRYTTTEIGELKNLRVGMICFDTTVSKLKVYNGTTWETITSS